MPNKVNSRSMVYKTEQPDPAILLQKKIDKIFTCISRGYLADVKKLLDEGVDINVKNRHGDTLLHEAYFRKEMEIFDALLGWPGIDLNIRNGSGNTVLDETILDGNSVVLKKMLDSGKVDKNYQDECDLSLLVGAACLGNLEILGLILQMEWVDVNAVNNGFVALDYAKTKEVANKLIDAGADKNKVEDPEGLDALLNSEDAAVPENNGQSGEDTLSILSNAEMV